MAKSNEPKPWSFTPGTYDAVYSPTGHQGASPGVRIENGNAIPTIGPNPAQNNQSFATGINIHSGDNSTNRGSAGCFTIAPDQANQVWNILQPGETGSVTISRTDNPCN